MRVLRVLLLAGLGVALCDCTSVVDSLRKGFYVNTSTVAERSHITTASQFGYRLGIPF